MQAAPGVPIANVSTYLLGSVFGALCHQNGLFPLHASAVAYGEFVTAFAGDSGAGKSTLAACLARRGLRIVADDICLLDSGASPNQVIPVAGWLKLWRESFDHLGSEPEEKNRTFSSDEKYRIPLPQIVAPKRPFPTHTEGEKEQLRLAHVVFLSASPSPEAPPQLIRLSSAEAIALLMRTTYLDYMPRLTGTEVQHFERCAHVVRQTQAFRLVVPWGWEAMDEVLDLLEQTFFTAAPPLP